MYQSLQMAEKAKELFKQGKKEFRNSEHRSRLDSQPHNQIAKFREWRKEWRKGLNKDSKRIEKKKKSKWNFFTNKEKVLPQNNIGQSPVVKLTQGQWNAPSRATKLSLQGYEMLT